MDILLSETMLEEKDEIFEKLSKLPGTEPIAGFCSCEYRIGFFIQKAFDEIESGEDIYMPLYLDPEDKDIVAATYFLWINEKDTQAEFLEEIYKNFKIKEVIE